LKNLIELLNKNNISEKKAIEIMEYYFVNKKLFGRPKESHYIPISLSINMIRKKEKVKSLKEAINFYMKSEWYEDHIKKYNIKRLEYPALAKLVNEVQKRENQLLGIASLAVIPKKRTKKLSE